jgi:hypothetical protein
MCIFTNGSPLELHYQLPVTFPAEPFPASSQLIAGKPLPGRS